MAKDKNQPQESAENLEQEVCECDTCEQTEVTEETSEIDALRAENEELNKKFNDANDKYLRILAEFDNARKRAEKERLDTYSNAQIKCVSEFLPMIDAMDRAIEADCTDEGFKSGVEKIYNQLKSILEKMGVKEIESLGAQFDPNLHNAIKQQETDEYEEGVICEVYQKGYMLGDKVLRYAMVVVAC